MPRRVSVVVRGAPRLLRTLGGWAWGVSSAGQRIGQCVRGGLFYSTEEMVRRSEVKVKMRFYFSSTSRELAEGK